MTKPKKKPKTGDVVGWTIVDKDFDTRSDCIFDTRREARNQADARDKSVFAPFRIAKIVLAK